MIPASEIRLVQSTWQQVFPFREQAARLFYAKLFEMDPSVRPLFTTDIESQGRKLTAMINAAVEGLGALEELVPVVQALGRRHASYGVTDEHYRTVGAALLWTLEQGLGVSFTPEVRMAWANTYGLLAEVMRSAVASALSGMPVPAEASSRASAVSAHAPATRPSSSPAPPPPSSLARGGP